MTIFAQILYELATKHVVAKSTLLTIKPLAHPVYRQIKRLKDMGLIKEIPCLIKSQKDRTQKTIDCLILTTKGIEYIKNNLCDDIPWAKYLAPANDAVIISDHYDKSRLALRFTRISTAGIVADIIGAYESTVFFNENISYDIEDFIRPTLMSIIKDAMQAYQDDASKQEYNYFKNSSCIPIQFHSSLQIKRLAAGNSSPMSNDMRGDRYSGMFISPKRPVLVYVLPAYHPRLIWSYRALSRELRAYSVLRQNGFISTNSIIYFCGILLLENAAALSCAFQANEQARAKQKQSKDIREFGEGLDHLWVAPLTYEGSFEVRNLMFADFDKENKDIMAHFPPLYMIDSNDEDDANAFPLHDYFDGTKYAVGIHIDIIQINMINQVVQRYAANGYDYSYALICRKWQIPYYQATVDPRVNLIDIDSIYCI